MSKKKKPTVLENKLKDLTYEIRDLADQIDNEIEDFETDLQEEGLHGNFLVLNVANYADREKVLRFIRQESWIVLDSSKF